MSWGIPESDQIRFRTLFGEMTGGEMDQKLTGNDVRPVLMKSNLDVSKLGQIWVLADIDQDGCLDVEEFIVSMYLTYKEFGNRFWIKISIFRQNVSLSSKFGFWIKISIFNKNFDFLIKISIFASNLNFSAKFVFFPKI